MWRVVFVAIAACYKPAAETACGVRCADDGSCPGSLRCVAGLCTDPSGATCPGATTDAPIPLDAPPDASIDAPPGCYGHLGVTLCDSIAQPGVYHPTSPINTTSKSGCTLVVNNMCVVAAQDIDIDATLKVRGNLPILFFATRTLTVESGMLIDAASTYGDPAPGPGGDAVACTSSNVGGMENGTHGGGGGAGGTFQGQGGVGGDGASGTGLGGNGGPPDTPLSGVSTLRGGCRGGDGGGCSVFTVGGLGGHGGGAVDLLAGQTITINGEVNVSGTGGGPGETMTACGGGGGGSGGLIVLDAPTVAFDNAVLLASGAGGGGSYSAGSAGPGSDPDISSPTSAAPGGAGNAAGTGDGDGGAGSSLNMLPGLNGVAGSTSAGGHTGGGAGGGGTGFIYLYDMTTSFMGTTTSVPDVSFHAQ